jgi:peptide methionine sulfoxide reductase msrA/msrB
MLKAVKMPKLILIICFLSQAFGADFSLWKNKINTLSSLEESVLIHKGTERAYSGKYLHTKTEGVYRCKICDTNLYISKDKFNSNCGWPSFDDAIEGAVTQMLDADGKRIEITCTNCGGHIGHVFKGEGFTAKNIRHCVNSTSLNFKKQKLSTSHYQKAYFAGGCFWGVEYYLEAIKGVHSVSSGFMGGKSKHPTYAEVIRKDTGHIETVEVIYDPSVLSYEKLSKIFFEIHDPTQSNGQGPDIGSQYLSAIFVSTPKEKKTIQKLIGILEKKGLKVVTKLRNTQAFYKAEAFHQDYYKRKGGTPYCHRRIKRF